MRQTRQDEIDELNEIAAEMLDDTSETAPPENISALTKEDCHCEEAVRRGNPLPSKESILPCV